MNQHEMEQLQLHRKMQKLGRLMHSMEAYQTIAKAGLTKQAAGIVANDLIKLGKLIGDDSVGLEAHAELTEAVSHANSSKDTNTIGDKILAAIKRFKEWLKEAYEKVKEQVGAMMVSFTRLRDKVTQFKEKAKTMPDTQVEIHIPTNLANQVAIQGSMNEGHFPELRGLANFGAIAYPEALHDFYSELAAVVKNFDPSQEASGMVAAIEGTLKPLNFTNVDTDTYPGNVMIVPDDSGYNYSIAQVEARVIEEEVVRKARTGAELQKDLLELDKVIDIAEKLQDVNGKVETAISKVTEATDALEAKVKSSDEEQRNNATSMITATLSTTSQVRIGTAGIVRYLGRVLEAHLKIMEIEFATATKSQRV